LEGRQQDAGNLRGRVRRRKSKCLDRIRREYILPRLLHHIQTHEKRLKILTEMARVATSSVIVSLWVDGNYKAWRRQKLEMQRGRKTSLNRFVLSAETFEDEIRQANMQITAKLDFLPRYALWRTYVLKVS